jgi:hypothetical protein
VGKIGGFTVILSGFRDDIVEMESDFCCCVVFDNFGFRDDIGEMERWQVEGLIKFRDDIGEMERSNGRWERSYSLAFRDDIGEMESRLLLNPHPLLSCFATILVKWKAVIA